MTPELHSFASPDKTAAALADHLAEQINEVVDQEGVCSILLSGGSTPGRLFDILTSTASERIPWSRVHLFWADERHVPRDDTASNFASAMEYFDRVGLKRSQLHPIPVSFASTEDSAAAYEHELEMWSISDVPKFDITLLGIGSDGHTASLFPGDRALEESSRLAVSAEAPEEPKSRITVTYPVLNNSVQVHFLVTGANKAAVVQSLIEDYSAQTISIPASGVRPQSGQVSIWMDASAAGRQD